MVAAASAAVVSSVFHVRYLSSIVCPSLARAILIVFLHLRILLPVVPSTFYILEICHRCIFFLAFVSLVYENPVVPCIMHTMCGVRACVFSPPTNPCTYLHPPQTAVSVLMSHRARETSSVVWKSEHETEIHFCKDGMVIWPSNASGNGHAGKKQNYANQHYKKTHFGCEIDHFFVIEIHIFSV